MANYTELRGEFYFGKDDHDEIKKALIKFAKSDRKKLGITKILPRFKAHKILNKLINSSFLTIEKSKEQKPKPANKHEKLPRNLRRYFIHDKVHFESNSARFWFRFIEPNLRLLDGGKTEILMQNIREDFDNYSSLGFETLSANLLANYLNIEPNLISSFWNKEEEIDIFANFDSFCIIGECKYKERKICKNVLNSLIQKADKIGIEPNLIALFSKSGFSEELLNLDNPKILLFDTDDFKILL